MEANKCAATSEKVDSGCTASELVRIDLGDVGTGRKVQQEQGRRRQGQMTLEIADESSSEALREAITQIPHDAREKKHKFTETIEHQIGSKNYDPQKDKHFSGLLRLPHIPHPKMKVCMLGDAQHVEEDEKRGLEYMDVEGLKKLNKNKKPAKKSHAFLPSEDFIMQIFCLLGPGLNKANNKLQSDVLRKAITQIPNDTREKKCKFTEIIELQIWLKNYEPQKDKHFSGLVRLPHIPRPKMKVCMLSDAQHVEEVILLRLD
ncbi:hypothetical protein RHSIM_Rhsim04G0141000 [Rhododendron simsii]|uniref:Uncharacterized protein n=1 Tax=Rhododendron simsii TaxID=118357 RepID=A0A834LMT7_RHOSS|nr:hypothetical protein RHSIM_Rhsim04G0141000 [Rhododendron simsii]